MCPEENQYCLSWQIPQTISISSRNAGCILSDREGKADPTVGGKAYFKRHNKTDPTGGGNAIATGVEKGTFAVISQFYFSGGRESSSPRSKDISEWETCISNYQDLATCHHSNR